MLFFVLSGFVLSLPYFAGKNLAYGPYLVRRFCRLYPPFAFAVLISALLCWLLGGPVLPIASSWLNDAWSKPLTAGVVMSHLSMEGIGWGRSIGLDSPIWSLIVEMRVSLIFPLLVLYIRRFELAGVAVALVVAFVCAKGQAALGDNSSLLGESLAGTLLLTGRYIVMFLLGVMLAARLDRIREMFLRVSPKLHAMIFSGMVCVWMVLAYTKAGGAAPGLRGCVLWGLHLVPDCCLRSFSEGRGHALGPGLSVARGHFLQSLFDSISRYSWRCFICCTGTLL